MSGPCYCKSCLPAETPWFNGKQQPVRVGSYKVRNNPDSKGKKFTRLNDSNPRWWNGKFWEAWKGGPKSVMGSPHHQWCGLTEEVK